MRPVFFAAAMALLAQPASAAVRTVRTGDSLQAAINAAQPGDEIQLDAGATFTGNFTLPVHAGMDFVTIRTALPAGAPPADGQRVTAEMAVPFAKIVSPNSASALSTVPGAHHWRIMLVEFPSNNDGYGDIIQIGDGAFASYVANIASGDYRLTGPLATPCNDGRPAGADADVLMRMAAQVIVSAAGPPPPRYVRIISSTR